MQVNQDVSSLSSVFIQSPTNRRRLEEQGSIAPANKTESVADPAVSSNEKAQGVNTGKEEASLKQQTTAQSMDAEAQYAKAYSTLWDTKHSSSGKALAYAQTFHQSTTDAIKEQFSFSTFA